MSTVSPVSQSSGSATLAVADYIRGLIRKGELVRGQRLPPERDLARQLGVSRTSVRAGLQALAHQGVLVIRHGAGTFVADGPLVLDSEQFHFLSSLHGFSGHQMFEARRVLESWVAGMAAERATSDDLVELWTAVNGMAASTDNSARFLDYDLLFHRAVARASGNPLLASIVEMVSGRFFDLRRGTLSYRTNLVTLTEQHRRIYVAIRERNSAGASQAMLDHLKDAERITDIEFREIANPKGEAGSRGA
ncbi:MAG: FadR/GntR family transcriptional regulator [Acidobacteriota bacterium]|jgi:GntR family transcriptional repressor for pyruvate dehydrogenase complex|nr:MAG: FadR family transcriptional regulator [Acidobacteriota bacterium]